MAGGRRRHVLRWASENLLELKPEDPASIVAAAGHTCRKPKHLDAARQPGHIHALSARLIEATVSAWRVPAAKLCATPQKKGNQPIVRTRFPRDREINRSASSYGTADCQTLNCRTH